MGGLKKHLPITFWTFVIGTVAIAGIPPFAGFFSKDEILHAAAADGKWLLWAVGLLTAGITAFYMFRLVFMTFFGKFRGTHEQEHHLHESPPSMTIPLVILAVGSVLAGFVNVPALLGGNEALHHFLDPVYLEPQGRAEATEAAHHEMSHGLEWALVFLAVAVAAAGIFLAWTVYGKKGLEGGRTWAQRFPAAHRLLANKYYVDEIYDRIIVRPLAALSRFFWKVVDTFVIDGAVNAGAFLTELTGDLGRFTTTGNVRNYALYFFLGVVLLFWWIAL
jgi:NADH-quinone oxidoreductase subunit L